MPAREGANRLRAVPFGSSLLPIDALETHEERFAAGNIERVVAGQNLGT